MERIAPTHPACLLTRYVSAQAKGGDKAILESAKKLAARVPGDPRLIGAYMDVVNGLLNAGEKDEAEMLMLKVLVLEPKNEKLQADFLRIFGYKPTVEKNQSK